MTIKRINMIQAKASEATTSICMYAMQVFSLGTVLLVVVTSVLFRVVRLVAFHPFFITTIGVTKLSGFIVNKYTNTEIFFFACSTNRPSISMDGHFF